MAKRNTDNLENTENRNNSFMSDDSDIPDGFDKLGPEQAPYVVKGEGVVVRGILMGRHLRKKATGKGSPYYYQIQLTDGPVTCTTGSKKKGNKEEVTVETDGMVSIDETSSLADLKALTDRMDKDGERFEVFIKFGQKIDLDNGQSFWEVKKASRKL